MSYNYFDKCVQLSVFKKAFCNGIIPAISFSAHTSFHKFIGFENVFKFITSKLDTSIGMKNQYLRNRSVPDGHPHAGMVVKAAFKDLLKAHPITFLS